MSSGRDFREAETREAHAKPAAPHSALRLVVMVDGRVTTHALPGKGEVMLGRSGDAKVPVEAELASRRHALLTVRGDGSVFIRDLKSSNGTWVRGRRLDPNEPVEMRLGDVVRLGDAAVSLLRDAPPDPTGADGEVVICDAKMRELHAELTRVAASEINVVLAGETGVGKEVFAQRLHRLSRRAGGPFVAFNCATFSESLVENELFGHEKGAFTGASALKRGLLECANQGTVFLDEVAELSPAIQARLLRVLQERKARRLGGEDEVALDVRFLCASHRNLDEAVRDGRFRQDLWYRLAGFTLVIPPLRERVAEVVALAEHFLHAVNARRTSPLTLSDGARAALREHPWPGNIRELRNVIERAAVLADSDVIDRDHLRFDTAPTALAPLVPPEKLPPEKPPTRGPIGPLDEEVSALQRARILEALEATAWNQSRAAELLDIPRPRLLSLLDKYGIQRPRKGRQGSQP